MDDQNRSGFENAVRNTNLPDFNLDKAYDDLQEKARTNIHHTPRQQGPEIICVSCPYQHSIAWIGVRKKMVGINGEGQPIIEPM